MGIVFWAMSISGYCVSFTGYENNTFSYVLMQSSDAGIGSDTVDYCDIDFSGITLSFLMANLDSGSSYISTQGWYKLIVDTTEGSFVMRSGNLSLSSSVTSIQTKTYTLGSGSYSLPGAFVSIRLEGSYFITMLNGSSSYYYQFSSASINGWSKVDVQGSSSDYSTILTQIYNELVVQGLSLDDLYNELLDQGISLDSLVDSVSFLQSSICYDMPSPVDTNYYLTTCSFSSLNSNLYNFNLNPCFAQFRFKEPFSNVETVSFKRPSSGKIMLLYSRLGSSTVFDRLDLFYNDVYVPRISLALDDTFGFIYYDLSSFPVDSFFDLSFRVVYGNDISLGIYEYRISSNDILEYMMEQWSSTQPSTDSLDSSISDTGDMQSDINVIEDTVFTDFTGAFDHTGIAAFSWTVFSGMSVFSSIVNKFYFALPSEFSLYITAVLIVGVIAVLISAVGRIIKKGGD